jgi:hypothetical protein
MEEDIVFWLEFSSVGRLVKLHIHVDRLMPLPSSNLMYLKSVDNLCKF